MNARSVIQSIALCKAKLPCRSMADALRKALERKMKKLQRRARLARFY